MFLRSIKTILISLFLVPISAFAEDDDGNRYDLERAYRSEISAASAYVNTASQRFHHHSHHRRAVIIDVRTIEEYVGGHPPRAYSIPFPHVYNRQRNPDKGDYIAQDPADFVAAVNALNLDKDTLIITMCRTGYRSVLAGNLLADAGYTNVQNMWQGFVGRLKQNTAGEDLDLDGIGGVDSSATSGDLDGWANYQGLPISYKLLHSRLYGPYMDMYFNVPGER